MKTQQIMTGIICLCTACVANADYNLDWYTFDGGGGASSSGAYGVTGTIGQSDAGVLTSGAFELRGGFWAPGVAAASCDGFVSCDANCDGSINAFDIQPFVELLIPPAPAACSSCAGDADGNGTTNQFDIQPFIECLIP